jgi:RNA polymerase sigma-70 factor (ECF subfamily)
VFIETKSAPAIFLSVEASRHSLNRATAVDPVAVHNFLNGAWANSFTSRIDVVEAPGLNGDSDEALMMRFCEGNEAAFDALFARHAAQVRVYLSRLTGNRAAADELTQTTFVSVVRARGRYTQGAMFRPWLYAIATNAARDLHRRRRKEDLVPHAGADQSVEMKVSDTGLEKSVRTALEQLPDSQRAAIVMHRFEGMSFAEIAAAQGTSEGAVKVRAHRGYEKLRELLRDLWSGV